MSDNIVLEHLRAIRATQAEHTTALVEIKERLGFLEGQYASISRRVDRIDGQLSEIRTRLGLVDPAVPAE
jgi:chromosome segregation ATPase